MPELVFGSYLAELLCEKGYSTADLSQHLRVDISLVRRWLRNERVPALHSGYLDQISTFLDLSGSVRHQLETAQVRSLKRRQHQQARRPGDSTVQRFMKLAGSNARLPESAIAPSGSPLKTFPLGLEVVIGGRAVLKATAELFENAPELPHHHANAILITLQGSAKNRDISAELFYRVRLALHAALQRGWDVLILWRLGEDMRRSFQLVDSVLAYLGTSGSFQPFYIDRYGLLTPSYDLTIVPGSGAMLSFSAKETDFNDAAICFRDPQHIELLRSHFSQLVAQAKPALRRFLPHERLTYYEIAAAIIERHGDRCLVMEGLNPLTQPASWYHKDTTWGRGIGFTGAMLAAKIEFRLRCLHAFQAQVQTQRYRDICPKRYIEQLVQTREYRQVDSQALETSFRATPEEIAEHLENVVRFLESYPKYEIALTDDHEQEFISPTYWVVKGDHAVLVDSWHLDDDGKQVKIYAVLDEPTTVEAFQHYFGELWGRISPRNKDKRYVIDWLNRQIDILRKQGAPETQKTLAG